ncbi:hypothetical protein Ddye_027861 [Dipteronia dyeriana]|uniref:Uncharacterized protein n=1 Tax=Dipteronia dyeriana TaxID=168575 RepID=A0AAD9WQX0_9ROSI|nr:hypothetical protein Ddye_027861 [Dipteronia dyeriana]
MEGAKLRLQFLWKHWNFSFENEAISYSIIELVTAPYWTLNISLLRSPECSVLLRRSGSTINPEKVLLWLGALEFHVLLETCSSTIHILFNACLRTITLVYHPWFSMISEMKRSLVENQFRTQEFLHRATDLTLVPLAAIAKDLEATRVAAVTWIEFQKLGLLLSEMEKYDWKAATKKINNNK